MKDVLIVYQPKPDLHLHSRRFLVSQNQLHKYITPANANKALQAAKITKQYKTTLRYRKYGKIDSYLK